jgi:hypothetical protein
MHALVFYWLLWGSVLTVRFVLLVAVLRSGFASDGTFRRCMRWFSVGSVGRCAGGYVCCLGVLLWSILDAARHVVRHVVLSVGDRHNMVVLPNLFSSAHHDTLSGRRRRLGHWQTRMTRVSADVSSCPVTWRGSPAVSSSCSLRSH